MSREKKSEIKAFHDDLHDIMDGAGTMKDTEIAKAFVAKGWCKRSEGEWVYYECVSSYDGAKSGYGCSRCGAFVDENIFETDEIHKEFCGSCGAKMKGGAK